METVRKGPFQITVVEKGTLDSFKNAVVSSKVEGTTTIISIVPEGSNVKEGDLLVELDSSALIEKERQQEITVTQAKSQLDSATKEVEIQETQNKSDLAAAELKLRLAEIDLEKYLKGDFEQQKNELRSQVSLQQETTAQALEQYEFTKRLVKKGYKTQNDLETTRIGWEKEKNNLAVAQDKLRVLEKYAYDRTITELQANAAEFKLELKRVDLKGKAALDVKNSDLLARKRTYEVELDKHERLKAQIKECKIYAPQDGQVIYANSRDGRSSDSVLIEVGVTVRERQALVTLPDLTEMKVNARIHESRISLVRPSLSVKVKVDAYPGEDFQGTVYSVASVPSSTGSSFMRDIKEYEGVVRLLDDAEKVSRLRPGLTASLEVLVDSRDSVLQAPIQSILTIVGRQVAYVHRNGTVERVDVKIGQTNDRMVEILEGLNEGDRVVMNPRTHFEKDLKAFEAQLIKEQAEKAPEQRGPASGAPGSNAPGGPNGSGPKPAGPGGAPGSPMPGASGPGSGSSGPGSGGPGSGGPGSGGPGSGGPGGGFNPLAMFDRMDADKDGKLQSTEWSERFRERAATMDADKDGVVTLDEFKAGMASMGGGRPGGGGPRPPTEPTGSGG